MSLLCDLHWLPIVERIEYKLCTLVYWCLQGNAPLYLADHVALTSVKGEACDLLIFSVWKCRELGYRLATELSPGTVFP